MQGRKIFGVLADGLKHAGFFSQAVVNNLAYFIFVNDNIVQLNIAMNDLFGVQILKSLSNLQNHPVVFNQLILLRLLLPKKLTLGRDRTAKFKFRACITQLIFILIDIFFR